MLDRKRMFALLAVALVAGSAGLMLAGNDIFNARNGKSAGPAMADWTTMFYFDEDNNLAEYNQMETNLDFLMRVGSTKQVNLVCLFDREKKGDSKVLYIRRGECDEIPLSSVNPNWTDEVNMGDPDTLLSFCRWAMINYTARQYNVMLSDHGGGWRGVCWDDSSGGDNLEISEINEVLTELKTLRGGKNIEVLSTEACLVGMLEFAHGIQDSADYYVASETYGYGGENTTDGGLVVGNWQFDKVWGALADDPKMTPEELAVTMVENFNEYGPWRAPPFIPKKEASDTMAAINLSRIANVTTATSRLSDFLLERLRGPGMAVSREATGRCLMTSESFSGQLDWIGVASYTNYDLYDFSANLESSLSLVGIESYTGEVKRTVKEAVIISKHGSDPMQGDHPNANGLAIYFPARRSEYNEKYENTKFAQDTTWDEMLKLFWFGP